MRTKTLLTVAAALAVSAITSMADTTYSQNVVGYINTTIAAGAHAGRVRSISECNSDEFVATGSSPFWGHRQTGAIQKNSREHT